VPNGGSGINSGDTAWVLTSAALVMLMTPGLALFYGGLVRRKNVLSTIMHSVFILALVSVTWVLFGFTLAFGKDVNGWGIIGGLDYIGLHGVGKEPLTQYAPTIPGSAYMAFQMMFAVITPALITGAFAERKRFKAFVLFSLLWTSSSTRRSPTGSGATAAGCAKPGRARLRRRDRRPHQLGRRGAGRRAGAGPASQARVRRFEPHDVRLTVIGAGLLWFGWFGFNGGSALAANGLAANAFVVTNTAAGMAALTWVTVSWLHKGTPSVVGAVAGGVAGLVAITPASGYVDASAAIIIGFAAGATCYGAILLRERLKVDDALDVWAVHGVGGTLGAILTGVFAVAAVNGVSGWSTATWARWARSWWLLPRPGSTAASPPS
jgi:Amt family ammonium transporter